MPEEFIMMPVPISKFAAVCAVLAGGVSAGAVATAGAPISAPKPVAEAPASDPAQPSTEAAPAVEGDPNEIDSDGWPWSAEMHASTKGKTQDGKWRMKVGVKRPDPKPGFPKDAGGTGTPANGAGSPASGTAASPDAGQPDEDDEFAAFRAAAEASDGKAANVPARKWTDADLGKLCNQAAVKLGDPQPVKDIIAEFVPEGQVPHSRNILEDDREAFAQAVETKAGITFEG